ncbi:MAG: amidohydrolase family protein [Planctomycetota bacterium]|jgi:predicted TIM-barrel fold metal-dependent hydrolase
MIIDAHAHVFAGPRIKYTADTTTFMSAEDQLRVMDSCGIDKAVILPMCNPEILPECQSIDEVLGICGKYPGRFIPFCNVDPRLMGALIDVDTAHFKFILTQYKQLGCRGLGELAANIYWDDQRVLALLKACENVGFPVTFHTTIKNSKDYGLVDEIGFPRLEKVLQQFPDLIFFGHSQGFWAEISGDITKEDKSSWPDRPVAQGGSLIRLMRNYPNLYGDISANSGLGALRRDPEFGYGFINEFQDKLVFGLDYCSVENDRQHIKWLRQARDQEHIPTEAYEKIMWKNISRVLKLENE